MEWITLSFGKFQRESTKIDNECTYKPWEGNKCFFTEALSLFGIDTSKFHFA